jgi:hypothetical protein
MQQGFLQPKLGWGCLFSGVWKMMEIFHSLKMGKT